MLALTKEKFITGSAVKGRCGRIGGVMSLALLSRP